MNARRQFFELIRRAPDDDAPRLIYADWLDEQGDPRGEFIRVQCELANLPEQETDRRKLLEERERALWKVHRRQWMRPLKVYHVREARFHRGFLETAVLLTRPHPEETSTQFAARWNHFVEQEPALVQARLHLHHGCVLAWRNVSKVLGWRIINGCPFGNCRIMIFDPAPAVWPTIPKSRRV